MSVGFVNVEVQYPISDASIKDIENLLDKIKVDKPVWHLLYDIHVACNRQIYSMNQKFESLT